MSILLCIGLLINGHKEIVEILIAMLVPIKIAKTTIGNTPLHLAAIWGHKEVVELLLCRGADYAKTDKEGNTPYMLADLNYRKTVADVIKTFARRQREAFMMEDYQRTGAESPVKLLQGFPAIKRFIVEMGVPAVEPKPGSKEPELP